MSNQEAQAPAVMDERGSSDTSLQTLLSPNDLASDGLSPPLYDATESATPQHLMAHPYDPNVLAEKSQGSSITLQNSFSSMQDATKDSAKKEVLPFHTEKGEPQRIPWSSVRWWFGWTKKMWLAVVLPISLLLFFTLFGVLTYYVLAPSFISYKLRTSLLETHTTTLYDLQEDGFRLNMTGSLHDAGAIAVTIAAMQNVTVRYRGQVLGAMSMPEMRTERGQKLLPVEITSYFKILDRDLWLTFNRDMMKEKHYAWELTSATHISVLGCTFLNIPFEKSLVMLGMNALSNTTIVEQVLPAYDPQGGIQLSTTISLYNPSTVSLHLGDMSLALQTGQSTIGQVFTKDFTMRPGQNLMRLDGILGCCDDGQCDTWEHTAGRRHCNATERADLGRFFSDFISGRAAVTTSKGLMVRHPSGNPTVSWVEEIVKSMTTTVTFVNPNPLSPVQDMRITDMAINMSPSLGWSPISTTTATAAFSLPPDCGFHVAMTGLRQRLAMYAENGDHLADLVPPHPDAFDEVTMSNNTFSVQIKDSSLQIPEASRASFSTFVAATMSDRYVPVTIRGDADSRVVFGGGIGELVIPNVALNEKLMLDGLDDFKTIPTTVGPLRIFKGEKDFLYFNSTTTMYNPGAVNVYIRDSPITYDIVFKGINVGGARIENMTILSGYNTLPLLGWVHSEKPGEDDATVEAKREFLSGYTMGIDLPIVIRGHQGSTDIPPLQAAMSRMMLDTEAKGIPPTLIRRLDFWPTRPPTVYTTLHNPLGVSMDLSGFDSYVRFNDPSRGVVEMTHLKDDVLRVHIEPQQSQRAAMAAEWPSKANTTLGRVNITATSNVLLDGQFAGTVYYAQNNVRIRKMGLPI